MKHNRETKLVLPHGEPNLEALRSVTREWLVPLLVEKFLCEQGFELRVRPNAEPGKTPVSDPLVVEGIVMVANPSRSRCKHAGRQ
ncbi:MAG TPA: hypothetical protein VIH76_05280 [Candidatus Acidoferrales bacterium]